MAKVIREADEAVFDLLDPEYVEQHLPADVYITFVCVQGDDRQDDRWTAEDGTPAYLIVLPFEQVKALDKATVQELMLEKARETIDRVG